MRIRDILLTETPVEPLVLPTGNAEVDRVMREECGELLGKGGARHAFACKAKPDEIIKIDYDMYDRERNPYQNRREAANWEYISAEYPDLARWLAPVTGISESGHILRQKRTAPLSAAECEQVKEMPPLLLWDSKRENFGMLAGRPVCHDYGTIDQDRIDYYAARPPVKVRLDGWGDFVKDL